jgi:hypothetical protein
MATVLAHLGYSSRLKNIVVQLFGARAFRYFLHIRSNRGLVFMSGSDSRLAWVREPHFRDLLCLYSPVFHDNYMLEPNKHMVLRYVNFCLTSCV